MDFLHSLVTYFPAFVSGIIVAIAAIKGIGWAKQRFFPEPNKPFVRHPKTWEKAYIGDKIQFTHKSMVNQAKIVAFSEVRGGEPSMTARTRRGRATFEIRVNADEWELI